MKQEKSGADIMPCFKILQQNTGSEQTEAYKNYRRKWTENPPNHIVEDSPIDIDFDVTSACNLKCIMCFQSLSPDFKKENLDFALYKQIIDEGVKKGLCAVKLNIRGEPLLYPHIIEAVKYAKEKGVMDVMLNTNAVLLTKEIAEGFIRSGLDQIILSVDSHIPEEYEKIRVGSKFKTVRENIMNLYNTRKKLNSKKPIIRIERVDMGFNRQKEQHYIAFWKPYVDEIAKQACLDLNHRKQKEGVLIDKSFACPQLWQRAGVLSNGDIVMCCIDVLGKNVLGNAKEDNLFDIWRGKKLSYVRQMHLRGDSHKIAVCANCGLREYATRHKKLIEQI